MEIDNLIIKNITRHVALSDVEKALLMSYLTPASYKKKQYVLKEGDISRHTNFVVSGCLRSYYRDENGFAHVIMFAVEDWWISDMYSYMYQKPANLYIDALEDTEVLQISRDCIEELYQKLPQLERFFRILTQNALAHTELRMIGNLSKTAEERYLFFREKYHFLENRLPQYQIASYLGVTPEFLSAIRKKLSRKTAAAKPIDRRA